MPRAIKDTKLDTRTARAKLKARREPYWRAIGRGTHLGYRKGTTGGFWIARYRLREGGKYVFKSLAAADDTRNPNDGDVLDFYQAQDHAREWFAEEGRKANGIGPDEPDKPYTVADTMRDYLAWYAAHRKPSGLSFATYAVNAHILPSLGAITVPDLTTKQVEAWHHELAATPGRLRSAKGDPIRHRAAPDDEDGKRARKATANRILVILRAGLNRAFRDPENGIESDAPWRRVEPFEGVDAAKIRYLTPNECTRLINASEPAFRRLVQAALLTGCRYGDLIAMQCDDFSADAGTIAVYHPKSGKPRHVPLNDEGVAFFTRVTAGREGTLFLKSDGQPWGRWHQRRRLAAAAEAAKLEGATFHILRHTYGSALAMQGVPMSVIAKAMGHSDTRMTEKHYAHLAPSYVADTIRANLPPLGIVEPDTVTTLRQRG